jgi:outer membrane protein insertion porin family
MKKLPLLGFLLWCLAGTGHALESFEIRDIRVEGLQRISPGTVFNYLPVKVGDVIDEEAARQAVRALFGTGFFRDIELRQDGNVLVVVVQERPSVAEVEFRGNKDIRDDALTEALEQAGLTEGRIFNQSTLDRVVQEIRNQYFARGRYSAVIETTVTPLDRNRVGILIDIDEGVVARIKRVRIIGNQAFTEEELLDEFELSTERAWGFLRRRDKYSREKLLADLESLRSFYQDQGYLNFDIESTNVSISPNKQDMFITIAVSEGERFTLGDISVDTPPEIERAELEPLITARSGDVFSRKVIAESRSAILDELANRGYAFANVNAVSEVDDENDTVSFAFAVDPGPKVYVRRINISGNASTQDEVIRREMRQLEGSVYSAEDIRRSRERVNRLGFFEEVRIDTPPVPGVVDQVDVNVTVKERATGSFLFGVGYSDADGALVQVNVTRRNLFGTGRELSLNIDNSDVTDIIDVQYRNPYHTPEGVSRGFNVRSIEVDATEADTAEYIANTTAAGVEYRIPLSEFNSLQLELEYENVELESTPQTPPEFLDFINQFPESDNYVLTTTVGKDTRDSIFFPSRGYLRTLSLEASIPGSDLEYYKVSLRGSWFKSVTENLTLKLGGELGYGDGYGDLEVLPFYKNFYAGGTSTVRGFDSRSLGPKDSSVDPEPIGGSQRVLANVELLFPVPGADESGDKRLSLFVDAGQVYGADDTVDLSELRYSAGIAFNWLSPVGPLAISYGVPLNDEEGDDVEKFQLTLGTLFR